MLIQETAQQLQGTLAFPLAPWEVWRACTRQVGSADACQQWGAAGSCSTAVGSGTGQAGHTVGAVAACTLLYRVSCKLDKTRVFWLAQ